MSNKFPSMTALLGLLAVAGYQHRDKIAEWLGGGQTPQSPGSGGPAPGTPAGGAQSGGGLLSGGLAGVLQELGNNLGGAAPGGILSGGLGELLDRFKQSGQTETA